MPRRRAMERARPQPIPEDEPESESEALTFVALPVSLYKALSDAAAARGMTFAQAFGKMVDGFLAEAPVEEEQDV
jgi:hypothetical protein